MKFGGSSVGDADRIKNVCDIIRSKLSEKPIVVLSAIKGVTDKLIETANKAAEGQDVSKELEELKEKHNKIIKGLGLEIGLVDAQLKEYGKVLDDIFITKKMNLESMDTVQSFGERMSVRITAAYLNKIGIEAKAYDAYDIGMITTPDYGNAEPLPDTEERIFKKIGSMDHVPVITGFIGKDSAGNITTLGRGGSDYTAAIIGAAAGETIEIWTDVNGIMSADPRVVKDAITIPEVSFDEASELAYFGARVLHPKTIWPAIKKNLPVRVLNSFDASNKGTTILNKPKKSREIIKAIACKKNISLISVVSNRMLLAHGFLARLFSVFEDYKKSVDMISTSEVSVSLTVDNEDNIDKITEDLEGVADVHIEKGKAVVCVVGEGMNNVPGISGRIFSILGKNKINIEMISQGASEINISFIVDNKDADKAVQALHKEFFGDRKNSK
ncbi:aspartate kinase [Candidatus Woesearchaeota archaeon]|nr:aspartate kinase [Candidatus Woesearchaeota archaeon]